jgi:hypothetical protein
MDDLGTAHGTPMSPVKRELSRRDLLAAFGAAGYNGTGH